MLCEFHSPPSKQRFPKLFRTFCYTLTLLLICWKKESDAARKRRKEGDKEEKDPTAMKKTKVGDDGENDDKNPTAMKKMKVGENENDPKLRKKMKVGDDAENEEKDPKSKKKTKVSDYGENEDKARKKTKVGDYGENEDKDPTAMKKMKVGEYVENEDTDPKTRKTKEETEGEPYIPPLDKRPKLQVQKDGKMLVIWDYENGEIPTEMKHYLVREEIIKKLRRSGFSGPIEFQISVAYWDSVQPKIPDTEIVYANKCYRPKDRPTSGNQAADKSIITWAHAWLRHNHPPQNILFISGDVGFNSVLGLLRGAGHSVILVSNTIEEDSRDYDKWSLRECLGLPKDRVFNTENQARKAAEKKLRNKEHNVSMKKARSQARMDSVENAQRDPIPKSIVEIEGSVRINIRLEHHTQKFVIKEVNDDCVHVIGEDNEGVKKTIMEVMGRRLGKKLDFMKLERVPNTNKWTLDVEDMTARKAFVNIVKAQQF